MYGLAWVKANRELSQREKARGAFQVVYLIPERLD
jgi:hypothetical protein